MHRNHSYLYSNWSLLPIKKPFNFFRRPQITKQMLISFASFWLLLRKPKWAICVLDQNHCSKRDHPSHAEALIPAHYSVFWDQDHLFALTARSDGTFCWRLWKTTNYLQDAASQCDASFIPVLIDIRSCSVVVHLRGVSWERDIRVYWLL